MTTIAWDIDDVIYPWYDMAHRACVEAGLCEAQPAPRTWHPYREYGVTVDAWAHALAESTISGALYGGEPLPEALQAFAAFDHLGFEQHFITARGFMAHADAIREQTEIFVAEHFPTARSLTFSRDKGYAATVIGATHAIDDNLKNYGELEAAGVEVYLMSRPWNLDAVGVRRVDSLLEFEQAILEGVTP